MFKNAKNEENEIINISETGLEKRFEYNNNKQTVTVIGHNLCRFCTELLSFLSTVDNNIVDVKYYNIYDIGKSEYKIESERVLNEFSQYFKTNIEFYPTVIIGNKYILGFNESKESEYINSIYHSYRNEIETVIK